MEEEKTVDDECSKEGFDVKLIDVNRTCKVTKGGQVVKYTAMLACGNYHGIVGFAKGPAVPIALQKTSYKKTKVYLWHAPTTTGMKAGRTIQTILHLAGFKNVKSKVVGSRNPQNTPSRIAPSTVGFGGITITDVKITNSENQSSKQPNHVLSNHSSALLLLTNQSQTTSTRSVGSLPRSSLQGRFYMVLHFINLFQDRSSTHGVATY
ncbi:hypothetical protein Vadar_028595 [Vaccinium darrowii]|uniref:Uncharacterized protein n=1 Tax=Vaccinium darrowii TaxID=229202 RepID=A0ACB7XUT6_9ERIC|nr:hypothetical protein Vadar_028595 [Vaccinium darrowii]